MNLTALECSRIIADISRRYRALWEATEKRGQHYFNDSIVDPKLEPPYNRGRHFQSDILRQTHVQLRSRITEHHFLLTGKPLLDTLPEQGKAERAERLMGRGVQIAEERLGRGLHPSIVDGQSIYGMGILHWRMAQHIWPKIPGREFMQEVPAEKKKQFAKEGDGWRETPESVLDRHAHAKALAGFPWVIETLHLQGVGWLEDRSLAGGLALVVVIRDVPLLQYQEELQRTDKIRLSVNEQDKKVSIYREHDAPVGWQPSAAGYTNTIKVASVWTRDEWYELVPQGAKAGGSPGTTSPEQIEQWEIVKSATHPYKMPPFALAPGMEYANEADPKLRYRPILDGLYNLKPVYDLKMAEMDVLTEIAALPRFYIRLSDGSQTLGEDGKPVMLSWNSAQTYALPAGAELRQMQYEVPVALIQHLQFSKAELLEAKPGVGQAEEITGTTQSWAVQILQARAAIEPNVVLDIGIQALKRMIRDMADVMSLGPDEGGFPHAVTVYARSKDGERQELLSVEPGDFAGVELDVTIPSTTAAEAVTLEQWGRDKLKDGLVTKLDYLERYALEEDAPKALVNLLAQEVYETHLKAGVISQEMAARFGNKFVLGSDGQFVGPDGKPAPLPPPDAQDGNTVPGQPATMGQMPPLRAPGELPLGAGG